MKRVRFFTSVKSLITENCHACVFCSGATQIPHHATLEKRGITFPHEKEWFRVVEISADRPMLSS